MDYKTTTSHILGRLEGHLDRIEDVCGRLETHLHVLEDRLQKIEKTHDRWRAWAGLLLGCGSFIGALLPLLLGIVPRLL